MYKRQGHTRQPSGAYRYLEVTSEIKPNIDSLAKIEQGVVYGIYTPLELIRRAVNNEDSELLYQLRDEIEAEKDVISKILSPRDFGRYPISFATVYSILNKPLIIDYPYLLIIGRNWHGLFNYLSIGSLHKIEIMIYLIYHQDSEAFRIVVQPLLPKTSPGSRSKLLRAAAQVGNLYQFNIIFAHISDLSLLLAPVSGWKSVSAHIGNISGKPNVTLNYSIVVDAYSGGNREIIDRVLNFGAADISTGIKIKALYVGRLFNLSNPEAVFKIVDQMTIDTSKELSFASGISLEVAQLVFEKFPHLIDPNDLFTYGLLDKIANVSILEYILSAVQDMSQTKDTLRKILNEPAYGLGNNKIARTIVQSYYDVA